MKRPERLIQVMRKLRALPRPVTAERLADELGVTPRTIYRDIDELRASGAVIDGAAGYGYTLVEDPMMPPLRFSEAEVEAIVLGLGYVREIGDPALGTAADEARAKLVAALPAQVRPRADHAVIGMKSLRGRPTPGIDPAILRRAAWEERVVSIRYVDAQGRETAREVWPLLVAYLDDVDLLIAWCTLRKDHRTFRVDRIRGITESKTSFRPRRVPLLREYLEKMEAGSR